MSYVSSLRMTDRHTSNLGHQFLLRTHSTILCEHRDNDKKMHVLHLLPHDEKTENGVTRCDLSTLSYLSYPGWSNKDKTCLCMEENEN